MSAFRPKTEQELIGLPEHDLVAYLRAARRAGDRQASGLAVSMLVWGFMANVQRRVAMKVPDSAIEEVAQSVLLSALNSDFQGSSVGEFHKWLSTIAQRRIADYHRNPKRDVRLVPLPTEHQGDDEIWGDEPAVGFEGEAIDAQRAVEQAYGELNEQHQRVVHRYVFADLAAADAGEQAGVKEANVHKIAQRFRDRVDELMGAEGDTSG